MYLIEDHCTSLIPGRYCYGNQDFVVGANAQQQVTDIAFFFATQKLGEYQWTCKRLVILSIYLFCIFWIYIYIHVHTILSYSHFALVLNLNSKWTILRQLFIGIGMAQKKLGPPRMGFLTMGNSHF